VPIERVGYGFTATICNLHEKRIGVAWNVGGDTDENALTTQSHKKHGLNMKPVTPTMNTRLAIERILQNFARELMKVFSDSVVRAVAQVSHAQPFRLEGNGTTLSSRKPGKRKGASKPKSSRATKGVHAGRKGAARSSTSEVEALSEGILEVLAQAEKNLSAREIQQRMGLTALDEGRFGYALGKLKQAGRVTQHGDRRTARYGLGVGASIKPVRARKAKPLEDQPDEAVASVEG
jgi:hypothetical protein